MRFYKKENNVRQIILDTETTGLRVEEGHRVIEIACLEMIDRKLTGIQFHCYINPEREVEAGAFAVHGITNHFLKDKPLFNVIAKDLIAFIQGAELLIHNAPFDIAFLNQELLLTRQGWEVITHYCAIVDTLQIARQLHVGQRNSLDALCKRYTVDNSKRDLHGALLDAFLLAHVYLTMTGGQSSLFEELHSPEPVQQKSSDVKNAIMQSRKLAIVFADAEEAMAHEVKLQAMSEKGVCLWRED